MIIGLAPAALAFAKMTAGTGTGDLIAGYDYPKKWTSLMFGMFVLFIASYATGLGNIPWQGNELFPLHLRGTGAAILSAGVWAANIFISASFLSIMNGIGAAGAFGFYAGICVVGYVFGRCRQDQKHNSKLIHSSSQSFSAILRYPDYLLKRLRRSLGTASAFGSHKKFEQLTRLPKSYI